MHRYKMTLEVIARFTREQYRVVQQSWHTSEPRFSSPDKVDSDRGWPSFAKLPVKENEVELRRDRHGPLRNRLENKHRDSHLGHIFLDDPRECRTT
ncbi:peptide-methionine (R)-S-oxide reductase [Paraburkholderia sp. LEh10]|uniref:peptide-methionine (R)-S-oxide reductase n=1 Tax=Paraburkholderia sp. LEh10 TaxID=2821353 RepID=UPI001AE671AF|nr:peptide-methionine (R)-S-oxide reductase [Paraburkholderia sp. LEh10]